MLFGGDGSEPPAGGRPLAFPASRCTSASFCSSRWRQALQAAFAAGLRRARSASSAPRRGWISPSAGRRNNPAVVARFLLQAINRGGEMFVVIPQSALSPLRQALSRVAAKEAAPADPAWVRQIGGEVNRTEVSIRAVLETADYTLGDLARLKVGDVSSCAPRRTAASRSRAASSRSSGPTSARTTASTRCASTRRSIQRQEFVEDVLLANAAPRPPGAEWGGWDTGAGGRRRRMKGGGGGKEREAGRGWRRPAR